MVTSIKGAKNLVEAHIKDIIDTCSHCAAKVHIEKLWADYHTYKSGDLEFYFIFRCKPCKKLMLKTFLFKQNPYREDVQLESKGWKEKFPMNLDDELSDKDSEHIPNEILSDYKEALKCKSIGAHRASCSMFRRSLQSALVKLGANSKFDLVNQINSLDNLPDDIKDWAHQIRIFGNWGAHPDKDELKNVDSDDATEAHDFISKFFTFMFIMPKKVELSRLKREEKVKKHKKKP